MSSKAFALRALPFAMLCLSATAHAGGLDLPTIAASHQGTSNANSAEAADASVIYYNPAGMAMLRGINVTNNLSAFTLRGKVEVDKDGTTSTPRPGETEGRPISEDPHAQGEPGSFWPKVLGAGSFFASAPLHRIKLDALKAIPFYEDITIGVGIFAPGGGNLNYKSDWAGRHFIDNVAIEMVNINPSMAIRFDDKHSVGAGVSLIGGHLRQGVHVDVNGVGPYLLQPIIDDFGAGSVTGLINDVLGNLPGTDPLKGILAGLGQQLNDLGLTGNDIVPDGQLKDLLGQTLASTLLTPDSRGKADIEMYGYGFGYNLGYLYQFNDDARLSLAYRSRTDLKMRGKLEWELDDIHSIIDGPPTNGIPGPDGSGNYPTPELLRQFYRPDTTAKSTLIVPARLSLGYFQKLNEKIDLMFDYTFIQTSAIKDITVKFLDKKTAQSDRVVQGPGGIQTQWRDSFKASIGMNYHYNDDLTLKTGFQYDLTPVPSARFRHPGAPDSDRFMFSLGANYKLRKDLTIDLGYSLILLADSDANYRDSCRGVFSEDETGNIRDGATREDCTGNGGTFKGRFKDTSINFFSIQMNQKF